MRIRIILKFFEKYKCSVIAFSRYVSNEQSCLKTIGLYDDLLLLASLFHYFQFKFSAPISFMSSNFSISSSFFLIFFLRTLSSVGEKFLYTYTNMYNIYIYIFENMSFCLTKKLLQFDFTCLTQSEQNARFLIKKQICNKQQRFTVQHRELQLISCNNL